MIGGLHKRQYANVATEDHGPFEQHLEKFKGPNGKIKFLALKDKLGASVLHRAAANGDVKVLSWLNETFEPNWTLPDFDGFQPIHFASSSLSGRQWLCETAGVTNLDVLTTGGSHLAWQAASAGNFECLDYIVSKLGPSCLTRHEKEYGFAPIENCIGKSPIRLLEWLRKVGYDFSLVDPRGNSFAHRIAFIASTDDHLAALEWIKAHTRLTFGERNQLKKTALDILNNSKLLSELPQFAAVLIKLRSR